MTEAAPEAYALARARHDRVSGPGSFDAMHAFASAAGVGKAVSGPLDDARLHGIAEAEITIRLVAEAIPGLTPPPGASTWFRSVLSGEAGDGATDMDGLRDKALSTLDLLLATQATWKDPIQQHPCLMVLEKGHLVVLDGMGPARTSLDQAIGRLERTIRNGSAIGCCVFFGMTLNHSATDREKAISARHLGLETLPEQMEVCLLATAHGSRLSLAVPRDATAAWKAIPYASEEFVLSAYVTRK